MKYSYDLSEDWVPASKGHIRAFWFLGTVNLFSGVVFMINYLRDDPASTLTLITALGFLISGILITIANLRKHQPVVAKESYYLKINDGQLTSKLGRFAKTKEVEIAAIKRAMIDERFMILHTENGEELYLQTSKIMHKDKKEEFEQIIRAQIPHH